MSLRSLRAGAGTCRPGLAEVCPPELPAPPKPYLSEGTWALVRHGNEFKRAYLRECRVRGSWRCRVVFLLWAAVPRVGSGQQEHTLQRCLAVSRFLAAVDVHLAYLEAVARRSHVVTRRAASIDRSAWLSEATDEVACSLAAGRTGAL